MRILISLTYYHPNISGLTIYARNLAEELVKRGHDVTILTAQYKKNLSRREVIHGVNVVRLPVTLQVGKGALMFSLPFKALRHVAHADVVNCHLPQFESSLIVFLAKLLGKKVILTHHADLSGWSGFLNRISETAVFLSQMCAASLADVIVVYTRDYARHSRFLKMFEKKLVFVYPPIKTYPVDTIFQKKLKRKIGNANIVIGFSGRIAKQKGLHVLFEATGLLEQQLTSFKVVFAGPYKEVIGENFMSNLKKNIAKYKHRIVFLGPIPYEKMSSFYSLLDVLVLPSDDRLESFGFAQVEAMLCGVPVVVSNLPGARIPVRLTGMGELAKAKDHRDLAEKIGKVLKNKSEYLKKRDFIEEKFLLQKTIAMYERLFLEKMAIEKRKFFSTLRYYSSSISTLLLKTSFWKIPLLIFRKPILFNIEKNYNFYIANLMDIWILKEVVLDRQYQFYSNASRSWIVVDVGAGIGDFSILMSKSVKHVYSFEPDKSRTFLARKNIFLNRSKNITLVEQRVQNLEKTLKTYEIKRCDLLKVDCEGCEYQIFSNLSMDTLKRIKQIVMEVHLFNEKMRVRYQELKEVLVMNGFTIKEEENPVHGYLRFLYAYKSNSKKEKS